jgi:hypothetical protein
MDLIFASLWEVSDHLLRAEVSAADKERSASRWIVLIVLRARLKMSVCVAVFQRLPVQSRHDPDGVDLK